MYQIRKINTSGPGPVIAESATLPEAKRLAIEHAHDCPIGAAILDLATGLYDCGDGVWMAHDNIWPADYGIHGYEGGRT